MHPIGRQYGISAHRDLRVDLARGVALRRRPILLMALSGAGYIAVRVSGVNLPNRIGGGWFLNPLAWQVLFFAGRVLGYAPPPESRSTRKSLF
ncbi:OpgC domain-containing protein [Roseomonas sp. E05]|uniref:OpgC domain-containing protein n=1 Tax=Roseomonas sp. E05 TaxID=3046310 RepID=UPI0024B9520C|nr:OpgC domain-containing protein [Roseomonas sp. E05]MDJ0386977.1 OpgC domain-containing protein [Roseomonas sp. E05]